MIHSNTPAPREGTRWSWALVGFYLSCAGVALGSTIGSAGFLWLDSVPALVVGSLMVLVSMVTCYTTLTAARRGSGGPGGSQAR